MRVVLTSNPFVVRRVVNLGDTTTCQTVIVATYSKTKSTHQTLATTTADVVKLLEFWDGVEISNRGTVAMYVSWDGSTPTSGADNTDIVEAGVTKQFNPAVRTGDGVAGSTSLPCHVVTVVGSGNAYSVVGVAGR